MTDSSHITLTRLEQTTIVAALIHYALHVSDPTMCVEALEAVQPEPRCPWAESIADARYAYRATLERAEMVVRDPEAWQRVAAEGRRFA